MKAAILGPADRVADRALESMGIRHDHVNLQDLAERTFRHSLLIISADEARKLSFEELKSKLTLFVDDGGRILLLCESESETPGTVELLPDRHRLLDYPNQVDWPALAQGSSAPPVDLLPRELPETLIQKGETALLGMWPYWQRRPYAGDLGRARKKIIHCSLPLERLADAGGSQAGMALAAMENLLWHLCFSSFILGFGLYDHKERRESTFQRNIEPWQLPPIDLRPILSPPRPRSRQTVDLGGSWETDTAEKVSLPGPEATELQRAFFLSARHAGRRLHIQFKGSASTVRVNQALLPIDPYAPLGTDATALLKAGQENRIAMLSGPEGAGILSTASIWIEELAINPVLEPTEKAVVTAWVRNDSGAPVDASFQLEAVPCEESAEIATAATTMSLPAATLSEIVLELPMPDALLWSPETPYLYNLRASLIVDGDVIDDVCENFGMRTFETRDGDYYLNGKRIFLKGVGELCASTRQATPSRKLTRIGRTGGAVQRRDSFEDRVEALRLVKFLGLNFTSFGPPIEICDCAGVFVTAGGGAAGPHFAHLVDDATATGDFIFAPDWRERVAERPSAEHVQMAADTFKRSITDLRNHPSVAFWYGSGELGLFESGLWEYVFPRMYEVYREHDPQLRPLTLTSWANPYDGMDSWNIIHWEFPESEPCRRLHEVHPDIVYSTHPYIGWYKSYLRDVYEIPTAVPDRPLGVREMAPCSIGYHSDTDLTSDAFEKRSGVQLEICRFWVGPRTTLDDLASATQEYHSEYLRTYIDHFRSLKPQVDDYLHLQLFDHNNQKGLIDVSGNLKQPFWELRELSRPIVVTVKPTEKILRQNDRAVFALQVVNDEHEPRSGSLNWRVETAAGSHIEGGTTALFVDADAVSEKLEIDWTPGVGESSFYYLTADFVDDKGTLVAHREHEMLVVPRLD